MRGTLQKIKQPNSEKTREKGMKWLRIDGEFYSYFGEISGASEDFLVEQSPANDG